MKDIQTETPETIEKKQDAMGQLHMIRPTRQQLVAIFEHLQTIGAEEALLTDDKQINRSILSQWFNQLVIRNDLFPTDLHVGFVLREFFQAIWHGRVTRKGNNLAAHLKAFRIWIGGYEESIRAKYYHQQNPSQRKKEIPAWTDRSDQEEKKSSESRNETLKRMYGDEIPEHLKKFVE